MCYFFLFFPLFFLAVTLKIPSDNAFLSLCLQNIYFHPSTPAVRDAYNQRFNDFLPPSLDASFDTLEAPTPEQHRALNLLVYGHVLQVPLQVAGRRTARFSFQSICGRAYGPADYIELARIYHVIFIEDVPKLDMSHKNEVYMYFPS